MLKFNEDIISARICPYCSKKPEYVDSSVVYGKSYGMIYYCKDCNAYVGVYKNNPTKSLGRLANKELREAKKRAHFYFDQIWKKSSKKGARTILYDWLSEKLNISREYTHIGMFDISLCEEVERLCKKILQE